MVKRISSFLLVVLLLGVLGAAVALMPQVYAIIDVSHDREILLIFFEIALLFFLSFIVSGLGRIAKLPSFVIALVVGVLAQDILLSITQNNVLLGAIVAFGATVILFGGGLEVPSKNFLRLCPKIFLLSSLGLGLTAILLSMTFQAFAPLSPVALSIPVIVLLGAVLSSTDPAAIIPILRGLRFRTKETKDLIISESAVTDVTGTLLTMVFLGLISASVALGSIMDAYAYLFSSAVAIQLFKEIFFGVLCGGIGFALLEFLHIRRRKGGSEDTADVAFFIAVPLLAFFMATLLGGSGYLAAFIAGLLMHMTEHLGETEHFFNHLIDGFLKPIIFILLGALVNFQDLWQYAGIGLLSALVFMFVIRPLAVFMSLFPWLLLKKGHMSWRELVFISFVRETGAIPAVLLVTVVSSGIENLEGLVPIGMWIILATLVLEPPLTPWLAEKLQIGESMEDESYSTLPLHPAVLLASRGHSHLRRMERVVDWASKHGMDTLHILLCPEDDYTTSYVADLRSATETLMEKLNEKQLSKGGKPIEFDVEIRKGLLQDNIDDLCHEDASITVLFVGKGVLDYRLSEIKELKVPFYFLD